MGPPERATDTITLSPRREFVCWCYSTERLHPSSSPRPEISSTYIHHGEWMQPLKVPLSLCRVSLCSSCEHTSMFLWHHNYPGKPVMVRCATYTSVMQTNTENYLYTDVEDIWCPAVKPLKWAAFAYIHSYWVFHWGKISKSISDTHNYSKQIIFTCCKMCLEAIFKWKSHLTLFN